MSGRLATLAGVAAIAAVAGVGTATRPATVHGGSVAGSSRPVTKIQLVCPGLDGSGQAPVQLSVVDTAKLLGTATPAQVRVSLAPLRVPTSDGTTGSLDAAALSLAPNVTLTFGSRLPATVITAAGPGAGNVVASQHQLVAEGVLRGLVSVPCRQAQADTWITGADGRVGRNDVLVVGNPGSTGARVTVSAWSVTGPVDLPKLQSLDVPAGQGVELDLADYVPDAGLVTLHLHAESGRVAAAVRDNQTAGLSAAGTDWLAPTLPPASHLVVPGFPSGAGPRLLVVTNPGRDDATVRLRLIASDRAFVPAGHPQLVVPPGRSAFVDLSTSLGGTAATAELSSTRPVVAAGMSQVTAAGQLSDLTWQPASEPLEGPGVLAENTPALGGGGTLALTTLDRPAVVRLVGRTGRQRTVQVGAGRTVTVDLRSSLGDDGAGPIAVVPVSGVVWASRSLAASGAHGPLLTSILPATLPPPIRLPVVHEDPRVAVR
jgi:hypothetical protein